MSESIVRHVELTALALVWRRCANAEYPYDTEIDGIVFRIRINEFGRDPFATVMHGEHELFDLYEWPNAWERQIS